MIRNNQPTPRFHDYQITIKELFGTNEIPPIGEIEDTCAYCGGEADVIRPYKIGKSTHKEAVCLDCLKKEADDKGVSLQEYLIKENLQQLWF